MPNRLAIIRYVLAQQMNPSTAHVCSNAAMASGSGMRRTGGGLKRGATSTVTLASAMGRTERRWRREDARRKMTMRRTSCLKTHFLAFLKSIPPFVYQIPTCGVAVVSRNMLKFRLVQETPRLAQQIRNVVAALTSFIQALTRFWDLTNRTARRFR
jgi:hypothetical protein